MYNSIATEDDTESQDVETVHKMFIKKIYFFSYLLIVFKFFIFLSGVCSSGISFTFKLCIIVCAQSLQFAEIKDQIILIIIRKRSSISTISSKQYCLIISK